MKNVLVIGGTRFFGRLLVSGLLEAGCQVTLATRGRTPDTFGAQVRRIHVDRRDARAMQGAFAAAGEFDVVFDQMCYSPLDAKISTDVFQGRVGRYVMSSTIEVYSHLHGRIDRALTEDDVDLDAEVVDMVYPWHDPALAEVSYGRGKRQAEAYFHQDGRLPVVAVRIGHVLAGPEDFTGRLANYVRRIAEGRPLWHARSPGVSSFIDPHGIAAFLQWVGLSEIRGPLNAAADGSLSVLDIHHAAVRVMARAVPVWEVVSPVLPSELSPYDFPHHYAMDTRRASSYGYRWGHTSDWLNQLVSQHVGALPVQVQA